jgi:hypothetical protein
MDHADPGFDSSRQSFVWQGIPRDRCQPERSDTVSPA